jgi:tRNA-specific 2-thiouridylase
VRVLVAMSGGVDSSVAAALLRRDGHEVEGVTLRLWGGPSDSGCCSVSDVEDARRVAAQLGIEHHVFDFSERFESQVVGPYVADHAAGRTPNPCVECNRHLKFDALLDRADVLGFDVVATGHHARLVERDGRLLVARGADPAKDQSYVLHPLVDPDTRRVWFPIGGRTKTEVRALAAELGLRTAAKPDSQDVCFVTSSEGRSAFVGARTALHPADVVDVDGRVVGRTDAVELVTIGQRRGLSLAGGGERRYVLDVDVTARRVLVGPPERLQRTHVQLDGVRWQGDVPLGRVEVQTAAHGRVDRAVVEAADPAAGTATLRWERPRARVAPGQSVVVYVEDAVVGGGTASR